jgi:hypothetical protein
MRQSQIPRQLTLGELQSQIIIPTALGDFVTLDSDSDVSQYSSPAFRAIMHEHIVSAELPPPPPLHRFCRRCGVALIGYNPNKNMCNNCARAIRGPPVSPPIPQNCFGCVHNRISFGACAMCDRGVCQPCHHRTVTGRIMCPNCMFRFAIE